MKALLDSFRPFVALWLLLLFFSSCESTKDQLEAVSNFDQYDIRYEKEEGEYIAIDESQLRNFVINQFELAEGHKIQSILLNNEIGEEYLKVQMVNKIGNESQFVLFLQSMNAEEYGANAYLLKDKICACTSCLEGCELKIENERCACICPNDNDPCTKIEKAIVEGNYKSSDFGDKK